MKRLSKKQILMLHTQLIQQTGGSDGVRDYNLLDSALETPFQSFGGEDLYPTLQAKAARLGYAGGLCRGRQERLRDRQEDDRARRQGR